MTTAGAPNQTEGGPGTQTESSDDTTIVPA